MCRMSPRTVPAADLADGALVPELTRLRDLLVASPQVLVLTGAGCSADSGLPVFAGPEGVYADPELAALSHADRLPGSLPDLWAFWGPMRASIAAAAPHPGHVALAEWVARRAGTGLATTVATQNVDDLHERSGISPVQHLHGRLDRVRCLRCGYRRTDDWTVPVGPPSCPDCGSPVRPDLVLFGEQPDLEAEHTTRRAVRGCELLLAIGTSSVVSTSTGLLRYARDVQALRVCVDPAAEVDPLYDLHLRGTAAQVLPLLLAG